MDTVFGVPGESYLAVLDGFHQYRERIRFVACGQEGGAAFMADAAAVDGHAHARRLEKRGARRFHAIHTRIAATACAPATIGKSKLPLAP